MQIKPVFESEKTLPIVFAFNNDYSKYFSVALQSIIDNSCTNKKYDIIALVTDVNERNKNLISTMLPEHFSIRFFDISECIPIEFKKIHFKILEYYSSDIYSRLFIPFLFQNYEKVLYLDSDIVVEDDISTINYNMQDKTLAAALDTIVPFLGEQKDRTFHMQEVLKLENIEKYFNSGVLLFNLKNMNLQEYKQKLMEAFKVSELLFPDQDILNKIFQNKVDFLPRKWNFNSSPYVNENFYNHITGKYKEDFISARKRPNIIHFTSKYKPWNSNTNDNYERFWLYARKTPFYEEILYARTQMQIINSAKFTDLYLKIKNGKNIILWGASLFLEEFIQAYKIETTNILGIIDSDSSKAGKQIGKYKIYSPEQINCFNVQEVIITIINADYSNDIRTFLEKKHIKAKLTTVL